MNRSARPLSASARASMAHRMALDELETQIEADRLAEE